VTSAIFHDVSVIGFDFFSWQASDPAGFAAAAARVVELAAAGKVALKTSKVFPQSDYLKALAEVEASGAGVVIKH
jgi:NADPH:quinone reductase-like Zn-dependent oxidoreductase